MVPSARMVTLLTRRTLKHVTCDKLGRCGEKFDESMEEDKAFRRFEAVSQTHYPRHSVRTAFHCDFRVLV